MAGEARCGKAAPLGAPARVTCESGMGRLDNNKATPADHADRMDHAVANKQPNRQINSEEEEISQPVKK